MSHIHWARYYLSLGISIVPIQPATKITLMPWKPYQQVPPTREQIEKWYSRWPDAGIGAILGPVSGLFVIDVDGPDAHQALGQRLGSIPVAPTAISGSGKPCRYHLYFRHPAIETRAMATPWHANLEFRGHRGMIIMPPSIHTSGNRYMWAPGLAPWEVPTPAVPEQVLETLWSLALKKAKQHQFGHHPIELLAVTDFAGVSTATKHFLSGAHANGPNWNSKLFVTACDLHGCRIPIDEAMPLLLRGARPWNAAELDAAVRTIESAYAEQRCSARELASQADYVEQPVATWTTDNITVRQIPHPRRRHLPAPTRLSL